METVCYINEVWEPIRGYVGLYEVSNMGRVRSLCWYNTNKIHILKLKKEKNGYYRVGLTKNGVQTSHLVHRLVAIAFIPNPNNYPCVNHKDENPSNNCVENLEWCTHSYNTKYGSCIERASNKRKNNKYSKVVLQYTLENVLLAEYPSTKEAHRQTGINRANIGACCNGYPNHATAGGYIWKFKD